MFRETANKGDWLEGFIHTDRQRLSTQSNMANSESEIAVIHKQQPSQFFMNGIQ